MMKLSFNGGRVIMGAVLGMAALLAAPQAGACIQPGSMFVTVIDKVSGNPIENCTVSISPEVFSDVTDNLDGVYAIPGLLSGTYVITVTSPCYPDSPLPSKTVYLSCGELKGVLFELPRFALPSPKHSADIDGNGLISVSEQLRVIQLYNSSSYHCQAGTEDGFAPGTGATNCAKHKSDYSPANWSIALPEVLRLIQFYNSGGYHKQSGTEDGYAPNCYY